MTLVCSFQWLRGKISRIHPCRFLYYQVIHVGVTTPVIREFHFLYFSRWRRRILCFCIPFKWQFVWEVFDSKNRFISPPPILDAIDNRYWVKYVSNVRCCFIYTAMEVRSLFDSSNVSCAIDEAKNV